MDNVPDTLNGWRNSFTLFDGVDFSVLYDWLPDDITTVVALCISFLFVLALIGLVKHFLLR